VNIVFRVDANLAIGSGHLMRCLTLAKAIRKIIEAEIFFATKFDEPNFTELIVSSGFNLLLLTAENHSNINSNVSAWTQEQDAILFENSFFLQGVLRIDILIVDNYSLDRNWERSVKHFVNKLVVIDDLAIRKHVCDILIDQNLALDYKIRYHNLVPKNCRLFLGISYLILRDEFFNEFNYVEARTKLSKVLVFFGGVDKDNLSHKFISQVMPIMPCDISIRLVIGVANFNADNIKKSCEFYKNIDCVEYGENIAEMMMEADLAIGAGGATTGERIMMGLPSIVYSLAENQVEISQYLHDIGLINYMGDQSEFDAESIILLIKRYVKYPELLNAHSSRLLGVAKSQLSDLCDEIVSDRRFHE
jgi:UDP-2,4-diacetamido-2,4,6-trideoxy-beta-L-altropyranose hydrolase